MFHNYYRHLTKRQQDVCCLSGKAKRHCGLDPQSHYCHNDAILSPGAVLHENKFSAKIGNQVQNDAMTLNIANSHISG